jgi:hypothetical protein
MLPAAAPTCTISPYLTMSATKGEARGSTSPAGQPYQATLSPAAALCSLLAAVPLCSLLAAVTGCLLLAASCRSSFRDGCSKHNPELSALLPEVTYNLKHPAAGLCAQQEPGVAQQLLYEGCTRSST